MPASDRGGLRAAFTNFNKPDPDQEAEIKLLGRTIGKHSVETQPASAGTAPAPAIPDSYQVATTPLQAGGLTPKPLLQREAVRQLSFRCPVSITTELRRKAAFNQLEQQEIIVEGIKRVLLDLPDPPPGWEN